MKAKILLLVITIALFSCKNPNGFSIKGKLKNANGTMLILDALVDIALRPIDSVKVKPDGSFEFTGIIYEPQFFTLRTSNNELITFVMHPSDELTIQADAKDFVNSYNIEGSDDCKKMQEYRNFFAHCNQQLDSLSIIYRDNLLSPKLDSVKNKLDTHFAKIKNELHTFTENFVKKNSNSFAAIFALYHEFPVKEPILDPTSDDISYYELVDSCLRKKYPNVLQIKSLQRYIQKKKQLSAELKNKDKMGGIGSVAPDINLPNASGEHISLNSLREKYYVLLYFWASWSRPCKIDVPILSRNYYKYHQKGLDIYAVSVDNNKEMWLNAANKEKLPWINVCDFKGWNTLSARLYEVKSLPTTILIDIEGKILARDLRGDDLNDKLDALFSVE